MSLIKVDASFKGDLTDISGALDGAVPCCKT